MTYFPTLTAPVAIVTAMVIADGGSPDPLTALWQIGIGALVAIPFILSDRQKAARIEKLEARVDELTQDAVARERALSDETTELLREASVALRETQKGMEAAAQSSAIDMTLRRLEHALDEAQKLPNRRD